MSSNSRDIFMDDYKGYGLHVTSKGKFKALKKEGEGNNKYYTSEEEMKADSLEQIKAKIDRITKAKFTPCPAWIKNDCWGSDGGYRLVAITSHNVETGDSWIKTASGSREKPYGNIYKDTTLNRGLIEDINAAEQKRKELEETIEKLEEKLEVMYGR